MRRVITAAGLALAVSGCAANVDVAYPTPADADETGEVLVRFSEPMTSVHVSVDGVLVAEDKHTERVRVRDVPAGPAEVRVVAAAGNRTEAMDHVERVTVDPRKPAVVLVATPPHSLGYWIRSAAFWAGYGIVLMVDWHR